MAYCSACMNMGCPQCNYGEREEIPFDADMPIDGVSDDCDTCDFDPGEYEPSGDIEDGYGGWQDDYYPEFDG
jgi:hypothetical protein